MRLLLSLFLLLVVIISTRTALAQVTAPSQGGAVGLVLATATTMELTFGTNGTGQGRVIAMAVSKRGMPVPLAATNGTFYTGNATYGQGSVLGEGFVVYSGAARSVTVTGLKPSTYYYITDAEYNSDATTIAYNTYGISLSVSTRSAPAATIAPLPVELIAFTGSVNANNLATLRWTTASEQHAAYFALERSADGKEFSEVGRVAAVGTSTKALNYQYTDARALDALAYYRLRQVDLDGTTNYSQAISLQPKQNPTIVQSVDVYPNPSAGQNLQLSLQGYGGKLLQLSLTDALGRQIMTQHLSPTNTTYTTPILLPQGLAAGTYILTLAGDNSPIQTRIIVSN